MKGPSKRRAAGLETRQEWTAWFNRFAEAETSEEKQAVLEHAQQINPGGTIRSILKAWGYSPSGRGRKAKGAGSEQDAKPARERLEGSLNEIFGRTRSPIRSLYPKLAGSTPITVRDAARIIAALIATWPEQLTVIGRAKSAEDRRRLARDFAEAFMRHLLAALSSGRSHEWTVEDMEIRVFKLIDEERIGVSQFIREAGEPEGGLIVAGANNILIGSHPVDIIRQFYDITSQFIGEHNKGIIIFVFDVSIFENNENKYNLIYNFGLLSTAMTAFALIEPRDLSGSFTDEMPRVDWSRWRTLSSRCCVVMRRPPIIDPSTGELLTRGSLDAFIARWRPREEFAMLEEFKGLASFDGEHVLPKKYPASFDIPHEKLSERDLYWDLTLRPADGYTDGLEVQYYIPAQPALDATQAAQEGDKGHASTPLSGRGRRPAEAIAVEEDTLYVVRRDSPGAQFDHAQRAIYLASRGRLKLDSGQAQKRNLNAAAALRQIGYEVLPVDLALSLIPRLLIAATDAGVKEEAAKLAPAEKKSS